VARHGYLREYDEAPDRSDNRGEDWDESNRAFMLDRDRARFENRDFSGGSGKDERRSRGAYGREHDYSSSGREQGGFGGRSDWERSPRSFSSRQDDHYRSWRDRQMRALDNEYADYCREREQQFHSDFDNWRRSRQQAKQPPVGEAAELELTEERVLTGEGSTPSPVGEATLGTSNSENRSSGRR
jgi:hypothetical protein